MLSFSIERDILLKPLLLVAGVAEKKHNLAILGNVLLEVSVDELRLNATDTEIEVAANLPLKEAPAHIGTTTLPAKKLIDICRAVSDNDVLHFSQKDGKMTICAGKSKFSLSTLPGEDFPKISNDIKLCEFNFDSITLKKLLNATYFSMAQQDVRYYLNGLLFEYKSGKIIAAATDGHRLAVCEYSIDQEISQFRIILPRKGVLEILKLLDSIEEDEVLISISNNHFYVDSKSFTFVTKLISGTFPSYTAVLPSHNDKEVLLDRNVLKKSLARVAILSNEKFRGVMFEVNTPSLKIIANNPEQEHAEEELEAKVTGDDLSIGFNVNYILDVLSVLPEGEVKLSFSTPDHGVLIESVASTQARYVIMPMKI